MNSTEDYVAEYIERICYNYLGPTICIIGILSNILNLLILTERSLKESPYSYLTAMAVTDLCALFQALLFMLFSKNNPTSYYWKFYDAHIFYPIINICTNSSVWLIVLLTVERFLFVRFPFWGKVNLNRKGSHIKIALVMVIMVIINIPRFLTFTVMYLPEKNVYVLHSRPFRHSNVNYAISWFYSTVINFIPLFVLCISNIYLLVAVHQARSHRKLLTNQNNNKNTWHRDQMRLTITLISIVFLFIACILPNAFSDRPVAHALFGKEGESIKDFGSNSRSYRILQVLTNFLLWCNLSLNFVLYCAFNTKFVQVFKKMLNRWAKKIHDKTEAMTSFQAGEMNSSELSLGHRQTHLSLTRTT
ncbi:probable G-protein coupled receptor B0563.6 [Patella vulgata]|uniref:probable G-protein coupled receptor B0563.6 n=1 Tax=Patella vulgata TaxID=6465 RepID=UPI00218083A6|nr:probable G-protein coupled receptor B0563.6 [Patella vulgata]